MKELKSFDQAVEYLYGLRLNGMKLGLDNTRILAAKLDLPNPDINYIHVAGTNGKGTICAILESVFRNAGYTTGLFTSPHLVNFNERIRLGGTPVSREKIVELTNKIAKLVDRDWPKIDGNTNGPTFFEATTVMALEAFARQNLEIAIMETGLGGRLDATNILKPQLCIISSIALDHQKWLGETVSQIAFEKAGIIKPKTPVVCLEMEDNIMAVIEKKAKEMDAPLHLVTREDVQKSQPRRPLKNIRGAHHNVNIALAKKACQILQPVIPIRNEDFNKGLEWTHWPARLQKLKLDNGVTFILDGAHNPQGVEALSSYLRTEFPGKKFDFLLGLLSDRPIADMLNPLENIANSLTFCQPPTERAFPLDKILSIAQNTIKSEVVLSQTEDPVSHILGHRSQNGLVVAGSLHFAGHVFKGLGIDPFNQSQISTKDEGLLNEWNV